MLFFFAFASSDCGPLVHLHCVVTVSNLRKFVSDSEGNVNVQVMIACNFVTYHSATCKGNVFIFLQQNDVEAWQEEEGGRKQERENGGFVLLSSPK